MTAKTWFITGASRGFGREWTIAALERGDSVAATARDTSTLDDLVERYGDRLLPLRLDVTDRDADVAAVREKAAEQRRQRVASPGDPTASAAAVLQVVDAEEPPLRLFLGEAPLTIATRDYESRLASWREW